MLYIDFLLPSASYYFAFCSIQTNCRNSCRGLFNTHNKCLQPELLFTRGKKHSSQRGLVIEKMTRWTSVFDSADITVKEGEDCGKRKLSSNQILPQQKLTFYWLRWKQVELTWLKRCSRQPCSLSCLSEEILMSHGSSSPSNQIKDEGRYHI